ncbi:hypothetical protein GQ457_11G028570 [Hibiscus cannabinus]
MEPLVRGQYPPIMQKLVKDRLPVFTEEYKELIKGSFDFIGLNYYTSRYSKNIPTYPRGAPLSLFTDPRVNITAEKNGVLIGPKAEGSGILYIYPRGLYKILNFVKKHYGEDIAIYISENGVSQKRNDIIPINQVLSDEHRIEYVQKHLQQISKAIEEDFKNYAEICFKAYGDRVKHWITINEPFIVAKYGYTAGNAPPGRCSDRRECAFGNSATEPYIAIHNLLLAHATAARLYKDKYQAEQGGVIGMSNVAQYYEPYSYTLADRKAARRAMEFDLGWFMEPLVRGQYPPIMQKLVKDRLPVFTEEDKELIKDLSISLA